MIVALLIVCVVIAIGILGGILWFFRAPSGEILRSGLLSPAYGEVRRIHEENGRRCIVIFLSPFSIHRQYYPCDGVITRREEDKNGNFYLAYDLDKSSLNEKVSTTMETEFGEITIRQIAGWFARVISPNNSVGDHVSRGAPMGMIEFGSRVDVIIPSGLSLCVDVGDKVYGYSTILAA